MNGPNPEACVSCLSAAVSDDLKDGLCADCAGSANPWKCNECLTSAISPVSGICTIDHCFVAHVIVGQV